MGQQNDKATIWKWRISGVGQLRRAEICLRMELMMGSREDFQREEKVCECGTAWTRRTGSRVKLIIRSRMRRFPWGSGRCRVWDSVNLQKLDLKCMLLWGQHERNSIGASGSSGVRQSELAVSGSKMEIVIRGRNQTNSIRKWRISGVRQCEQAESGSRVELIVGSIRSIQ